jgi:membrane protein
LKIYKKLWLSFKKATGEFIDDRGLKLSASLSYYTIFSLGPLLVVIISLTGIFWGREAIEGRIYGQIDQLIGHAAAIQVQEIIQNVEVSELDSIGAAIGIIFLIIGATTVFAEMQDSINFIWSVKPKPKKGFVKLLLNRLISFSLLLSLGFLLLVSLIIDAVMEAFHDRIKEYFSYLPVSLLQVGNWILIFGVITCLFAIIYKVLPDAKVNWRVSFIGASFTAVLFLIGKSLINLYVSYSSIGSTYGTATAVIIILVWVYYSSVILFFGAEFTKVFAINFGGGITPDKTAVFVERHESDVAPDSDRINIKKPPNG